MVIQRRRPALEYLFFGRFPLAVALFLVGFPFFARWTAASSLFGNLFVLTEGGLFRVTWFALLVAWVVMVTLFLIQWNAPYRFHVSPLRDSKKPRRLEALRFALLAVPLVAGAVEASDLPPWIAARAVALGALSATACLMIAALLHSRFRAEANAPKDVLLPGLERWFSRLPEFRIPIRRAPRASDARSFFDGYFERETGRLRTGHLMASALTVVTGGVYALFGRSPALDDPLPALAYLLLLSMLATWVLPALSFFLDRYRVSVLLLGLVVAYGWGALYGIDHYLVLPALAPEQAVARESPPRIEFESRGQKIESNRLPTAPEPPVVLVAASGGGITAALWTATVLTEIQNQVGDDATRAIRLISSVSGGSVGAMMFLDRFTASGAPRAETLADIRAAAGRSSLDQVAWGIAYPDVLRWLLPNRFFDATRDRGWAMEQAWRRQMVHQTWRLSDLRRGAADGRLPAVAFNATEAESGRPFLFSTFDDFGHGVRLFSKAYPDRDIDVTTAARASATFPWVSPLARPCAAPCGAREQERAGLHLADGGYYDNYGVATAIAWLGSLDVRQRDELRGRTVLLVLIRAFSLDAPNPEGSTAVSTRAPFDSLRSGLFGPILTMYNVRNASQSLRNDAEIKLFRQAARGELGIEIEPIEFELTAPSPLSWKLTCAEKRKILDGFVCSSNGCRNNLKSLDRLATVFERTRRGGNTPLPDDAYCAPMTSFGAPNGGAS